MRPDFGMFERPHPTAALFIFPANQTPRFGEKQLLMNLMGCMEWPHPPSRLLATTQLAHQLRLPPMVCGSRSRPNALLRLSRSYSRFLAINQLTTMAAPLARALFELRTVNSPKMSAFDPHPDARALVSNRLVLPPYTNIKI